MSNPPSSSRSNRPPSRPRKPRINLGAEAVKVVLGGVLGVALALAILKYVLRVEWFGRSRESQTTAARKDEPPSAPRPAPFDREPPARPRAKLPVPSAESQAAIRREIENIFAEQLSGELLAEQKQTLALRMAQLADEAQDRPEEQFVLRRKAAELAAEAGDLGLMAALVNELAVEFTFDPLTAKAAFVKQFAERANNAEEIESLVLHAKTVIDQARADDRYEVALPVAESTLAACRRPAGEKHLAYVEQGYKMLAVLQQRWSEYQAAKKTLESSPDDPAANLIAGRWLCLEKGEGNRGLAHLAKGGDHPLANAARRDRALTSLPSPRPEEALALADLWHDAAWTNDADRGFLGRAFFWYKQAQPSLSGEDATRVDERLDNILAEPAARQALGL